MAQYMVYSIFWDEWTFYHLIFFWLVEISSKVIVMVWRHAIKKPIKIRYRELDKEIEQIKTLEGVMLAYYGHHYIIEGVNGELYPIEIDIFNKTYTRID